MLMCVVLGSVVYSKYARPLDITCINTFYMDTTPWDHIRTVQMVVFILHTEREQLQTHAWKRSLFYDIDVIML